MRRNELIRRVEEPLVEPLRTAVSAEMANSGHALHPAICRSDGPELVVVVVACGATEKRFVKMNIRVRNRNATTRPECAESSDARAFYTSLAICTAVLGSCVFVHTVHH